jgi:hypothetical protein
MKKHLSKPDRFPKHVDRAIKKFYQEKKKIISPYRFIKEKMITEELAIDEFISESLV